MSRETDSSSAGPNGRGGAAYPSGTPPYGTPMVSEDGLAPGRPAAQPEERKTETTLTTRIRINIPGSRPIPPVVVRTPVAGGDTADEPSVDTPPPSPVSPPGNDTPAQPPAPAEEKASDWFAPRKPSAAKGPQGGGSTNGAGMPSGGGIQSPDAARPAPGGPGASGARPGGSTGGAGPLGARPGGTNGKGLPGATGAGPVAPGHGGGTGSFDVSEAVAATTASMPVIRADGGTDPGRDGLPYFSEPGAQHPSGPTGGPVTGDGPVVPPVGGPGTVPGGPGPMTPGNPGARGGGPFSPGGPGAHGAGAGQGRSGGLSDDTAILTPQRPAPDPGGQGFGGPGDHISGHTVTSGIPVVPPGAQNGPFAPTQPETPAPHTPPKLPDPAKAQTSASARPARKKGRSKTVLLVGALVVVAGVAYGAGLLMNHSDVPKGTTVLGVDIGGGTRDEAIQKLDDGLGSRTAKPLQLSVDGRTTALKPDQAGLQLDSKATVAAAAESDYNPMSVIGSLFGQERVIDPVMPVDEEKLQAALEGVAGGSGSMTEGGIKFESGKAVAVYGKEGKGIDVGASTAAVEQAYRTQVETNSAAPVKVPTTTRKPTVSNAEVDRMMKAFAEPAMSGNVTVRTDAVHTISFSPQNSLWKFLGVKAVNGKLVDTYDRAALQELYGNTFDGVLVNRGTGKKTAVTVEDVIGALRPALLAKTPADRIATIETNPS
ncbi:hypothetical protein [Streptomyces sp. NPDC001588]